MYAKFWAMTGFRCARFYFLLKYGNRIPQWKEQASRDVSFLFLFFDRAEEKKIKKN